MGINYDELCVGYIMFATQECDFDLDSFAGGSQEVRPLDVYDQ
jgi:hypothetical protein